ncbi:MAG: toll/interleukin-1 receptor domain-containing protein [Clostridium celatum]|nr:toll/interleukin-1 receptor domain-containing protein [Clostridium celatum]
MIDRLNTLISEGENIRVIAYKSGIHGIGYLSGEEFNEWLTKCKLFINSNCKDEIIKNDAIEIINSAHGNSISSYEKLIGLLRALLDTPKALEIKNDNSNKKRKIFVSHCSKNRDITNRFVDLLKLIGVKNQQLYYTSYEETGAEYLEDCLDSIEREFSNYELMVIFMLSREFYKSDICMAETGATWVLCNKRYIPVIIPPYKYEDIKGVVKNTQNSILLNDSEISSKLEKLKITIEDYLNIENTVANEEWTRKKEEFIEYIKEEFNHLQEVEAEIKDILIRNNRVICKVGLINNTTYRQRLEEIKINIISKNGEKKEKIIDDYTVTSILLQPLEELNFYINMDKIEGVTKNSQIDKKKSSLQI